MFHVSVAIDCFHRAGRAGYVLESLPNNGYLKQNLATQSRMLFSLKRKVDRTPHIDAIQRTSPTLHCQP